MFSLNDAGIHVTDQSKGNEGYLFTPANLVSLGLISSEAQWNYRLKNTTVVWLKLQSSYRGRANTSVFS